jgi:Mg-chelatase subunit ChlD
MDCRLEFIRSLRRTTEGLLGRVSAGPPKRTVPIAMRESLRTTVPDGDPPRDTAAVLDVSASMGIPDCAPTRLKGGVGATLAYADARRKTCPGDRMAVISFNHAARVVLPFTSIAKEKVIGRALRRLRDDGGTDLAEGLQATARLFTNERSAGRRRHIILLTDGQGGEPLEMAIMLKERLGVVIDAVGIGGSPNDVNEALLRQVATTDPDGFCHYRFIKDTQTLSEHYTQLAQGLIWRGSKK